MLIRCCNFRITLNKEMFVVTANSGNYCGYTLSGDISSNPSKVSAIKNFPTPANLTDICSSIGLIN